MGKRGPKPKSNKKKALEGNPGNRKLTDPEQEVDITSGSLRLPTRLCTEGKAVWRDLMASFPTWYFTAADKDLLIIYCEQVALKTKLEKAMKGVSPVTKRGNGAECLNPRLKLIQETAVLILKLADKLQITREKRKGLARDPGEPPAAPSTPDQTSGQDGAGQEDDVGNLMAPAIFAP